jgi:hypothetical protein
MYNKNFPRWDKGRNSANKSNGTASPPTPNPTRNLHTNKNVKLGEIPEANPPREINIAAAM